MKLAVSHNVNSPECIWADQCNSSSCDYYSPLDDMPSAAAYFDRIVKENYIDYMIMVEDYSDGNRVSMF